MLKKSLTILAALACGALLGVAIVFVVSKSPPREQLVGGQPLSYWLMCLDSERADLCRAAEANLPLFGAAAAPPLIERLDSNQPEIASPVLWTLTCLGAAAVPDMTAALRTASPSKRVTLIRRLQVLSAAASAPASPQIAECLDDPLSANAAARYFVALGPTREAIAVSARIVAGPDQTCRLNAIKVLAAAPNDTRAVMALLEAMKTTDSAVLQEARAALYKNPNPPDQALTFMIDRFAEDPEARSVYRPRDFMLLSGPRAEFALGKLAGHPSTKVRVATVQLLNEIAWRNRGDPTALKAFLDDPSPSVRLRAESAVGILKTRFGGKRAWAARNPPPQPMFVAPGVNW